MTATGARRSSDYFDELRAKALQGQRLRELGDGDREWVWRSLLKGVRRAQAVALSGLRDEQIEPALARVRRWYQQRIDTYKQRKQAQPKVVRPVVAPPAKRGWFGRRRCS